MASAEHMLRTGRRGYLFELQRSVADLTESVTRMGLAWSLAWHDVVARYRGSILGPFWITLSMAAMVLGIGLLYANLFNLEVREFLPWVAIGIVLWGLISGGVNDGCTTFTEASGMLRQTALPMFTFLWRSLLRNLINFGHHVIIIALVLVWRGEWWTANLALALGGLALVLVNVGWIAMVVGVASARFRDIPQIVMAVVQFSMFMTPVFWKPDQIPERHIVLSGNPFYYMLEAIRSPLLGAAPDPRTWPVLTVMALAGWTLALAIFSVTRRRIVHYL